MDWLDMWIFSLFVSASNLFRLIEDPDIKKNSRLLIPEIRKIRTKNCRMKNVYTTKLLSNSFPWQYNYYRHIDRLILL